jgi:hypothetical protein
MVHYLLSLTIEFSIYSRLHARRACTFGANIEQISTMQGMDVTYDCTTHF